MVYRRLTFREFYFSECDETEKEYYPPQISRHLPKWHEDLPIEWTNLLKEIYTALHANSKCLALMGVRALIDLYLTQQLGDIGGFKVKIDRLYNDRLISKPNKDVIETALEAGHAAAHRGYSPNSDDINQITDILENLLHSYVLKINADNLKDKTPKRK